MSERKKKVFISVTMSGKEDALIERAIQICKVRYLKAVGKSAKEVEFYDNFHGAKGFFSNSVQPPLRYLGYAIYMLADCDEAAFGEGWKSARGCRIEYKVCQEYGIKTYRFGKIVKIKKDE